jgi:hypothetical protein
MLNSTAAAGAAVHTQAARELQQRWRNTDIVSAAAAAAAAYACRCIQVLGGPGACST